MEEGWEGDRYCTLRNMDFSIGERGKKGFLSRAFGGGFLGGVFWGGERGVYCSDATVLMPYPFG